MTAPGLRYSPTMIRALIFDFDGLILDTETPELVAWQETFVRHGTELTLETWVDCVGRPPGTFDPCLHLEELLGRRIDRDVTRTETRSRARELVSQEQVRPGVSEWLDQGSELELRLGVASSSSRRWVETHLERLGLLARFETLVCFEDVERHKPDPEPYRTMVERFSVRPEEAVAVEDSSHGLQSARSAGLWCVAVPNRVTHESVRELGHIRLQSLAEVSLKEAIEALDDRRLSRQI